MKKGGIIFSLILGLAVFAFFFVQKVGAEDMSVGATVPAICGNGFEEGSEECDDGNLVSGDDCSNICEDESSGAGGGGNPEIPAQPFCGNGTRELAEQCDDGNAVNTDLCTNACKSAVCGDGITQPGEICDDGNQVNDDFCSNVCRVPICGDTKKQGSEQCDDGNWIDGDGCSAACMNQDLIICGDGLKQGVEECDDRNVANGDGCSSLCKIEIVVVCGDGDREGAEQCDDGNLEILDGCSNQCLLEVPAQCGNHVVEGAEQCDDGNGVSGDGCSLFCQDEDQAICGNGVKEWMEECDDGNFANGDGCNNMCKFVPLVGTVCGNSMHEAGEQCDDGNRRNNDGCNNMCQRELPDEVAGQNAGDPQNNIPMNGDGNGGGAPDGVPAWNPDMPVGQVIPVDVPVDQDNSGSDVDDVPVVVPAAESVIIAVFDGVDTGAPVLDQAKQVFENVKNNLFVAKDILKEQGQVAGQRIQEIADNSTVEQINEVVVAPATVAVVAAMVAPSLGSVGIPFFHFLFLQPVLFFNRKKRAQWGQIYNSLTKLPVDLAMVRLVNPTTKRVIQSRVTDTQGRYLFFVEPGEYLLEISKPGFTFPSKVLEGEKIDGKFLDLYHGELLRVTEKKSGLTPNIPLDPLGTNKTVHRIKKEKLFLAVQHGLSSTGIVINAISAYISPVWYVYTLLAVQIIVYALFFRLVKPKTPKGWGVVYEKTPKHRVENAIVRLFTKKYNKLVSTQVTDKRGRYAFLVGPNDYYVTFEKKGYKVKQSSDISIPEVQKAAILKPNVKMEKDIVIPKVENISSQ
jgi:cysteine-rich repeat protein